MHLLHLDSSARRESLSRSLGRAFATAFGEQPGNATTYRDLAADPVPHITEGWTEICDNLLRDQVFAVDELHRGVRSAKQAAAWAVVEPLLAELLAADVVLITAPMYNFGVPSALKAWIDQVTFPRMDLGERRFVIIGAQGGSYQPGRPRAPMEHHLRYLTDFIVGHYAVAPPVTVVAELGNARVDPGLAELRAAHEASLAAAYDAATQAGRALGSAARVASR